jgi:response regulator RpfG family c-di-GMP phosphodiesterase
MRARSELRELPVILVSATADAESVKRAAALGVRHFLVKPVNGAELLERVRETLRARKPPLAEKSRVLAKLAIDQEAYAELVARFAAAVDAAVALLEESFAKDADGAGLKEVVAGLGELADGAQVLGAERVAAALRRTTTAGSPEETKGQCRLLLRELKRLQRALAAVLPPPAADAAAPPPPEA